MTCFGQAAEYLLFEAFIAKSGIEGFNKSILRRFTRSDVMPIDLSLLLPFEHRPGSQFGAKTYAVRDAAVLAIRLLSGMKVASGLVRAAGLEPAQGFRPYGFSYHFGFRRRPLRTFVVWTIPSP